MSWSSSMENHSKLFTQIGVFMPFRGKCFLQSSLGNFFMRNFYSSILTQTLDFSFRAAEVYIFDNIYCCVTTFLFVRLVQVLLIFDYYTHDHRGTLLLFVPAIKHTLRAYLTMVELNHLGTSEGQEDCKKSTI